MLKEDCTRVRSVRLGLVVGAGAADTDLSTTAAPQPRDPVERGAARAGSVTSALTFDDFADVSHANAGTAVAAARAAESSTVAGAGAGAGVDAGAGAETEETVVVEVAEEGRARQRPGKGETLDDALGGDGAECSGGVVTTAPEDGGQDAAAVSPANANRGGPPPSTDASLSTSHHGDTLWLGPARGSASSRLSGDGGEATADRFTPATTAATAISSTSVAPPGLRPRVAVREGDGTGTNGSSGVGGATPGGNKDDEYDDGAARAQRHPKREGGVGGLGEGEGGGAAEWWREALGPTSRRPVTRRSLVGVGAVGGGTRSAGCIWEQHGGGGGQTSDNNCSIVCGGYSGERRRSRGAAPICGFSTESKQRDLEDFLKRRCVAGGGGAGRRIARFWGIGACRKRVSRLTHTWCRCWVVCYVSQIFFVQEQGCGGADDDCLPRFRHAPLHSGDFSMSTYVVQLLPHSVVSSTVRGTFCR